MADLSMSIREKAMECLDIIDKGVGRNQKGRITCILLMTGIIVVFLLWFFFG